MGVHQRGADGVDAIMPVMRAAFDPTYGEAWTADQCLGFLSLPGSCLFIAEQEHAVIGFALARYVFEEAELLLIAVDPLQQGNGAGRELIVNVISWAKDQGVKILFLEVRSDNQAIDLYKKFGFREVGLRKDYYRGRDNAYRDAITLRLDIMV